MFGSSPKGYTPKPRNKSVAQGLLPEGTKPMIVDICPMVKGGMLIADSRVLCKAVP